MSFSLPVVPELPARLYPSRLKMVGLLTVSLLLMTGGIFTVHKDPMTGYFCAGFFGICAAVGVIGLLPGSAYLELTVEGFEFSSLYRKHFVPWRQVKEFVPMRIKNNTTVAWIFVPEFKNSSAMRKLTSAVTGVEAGLPDTYGLAAVELASIMNTLRTKFVHART